MRNRKNVSNIPITERPRPQPKILSMDTVKAAVNEFVSTFIFVFAATGSRIVVNKITGDAVFGLIATAIAQAFALTAAVSVGIKYTDMNPYTCCGHLNPAVTFAAFIGGNLHIFRALIYWIAQLLASIAACGLLVFFPGGQWVPVYRLSNGVGVENALVLEMVMTFILVFTMCATVFDPKATKRYNAPPLNIVVVVNDQNARKQVQMPPLNRFSPLAIGLIVGANILVGGPFDGASMNPVLSFGPALVTWSWSNHWVYWVGPFIGGGIAGFVYDFAFITK
ncbi:probable aquaporin TIP-type [Trifolium pratense]|uniref:probable aquaporin TIP-type n=1 Tax=Trifolium pratense TaxID=57577 RepID=UPI001E698169|nr:probable aquaporin TIP-type [Trifolium pratense]